METSEEMSLRKYSIVIKQKKKTQPSLTSFKNAGTKCYSGSLSQEHLMHLFPRLIISGNR